MRRELIIWGLLFVIAGCDGGDGGRSGAGKVIGVKPADVDKPDAASEDERPQGKSKPWDPSLGTAAVSGVVKFSGKPPERRAIDMSSRKECTCLHSEPVLMDSIIVNENGTLKNVFVWVKRGLRGWDFPTPGEPIVLDQQGCMFQPHVQGVQTGQDIRILNSDPCTHNVHAFSTSNTPFSFTQTEKGMEDTRQFRKQDVMVLIKCELHGWMRSYLGVVDHPFFATTGEDGKFEFPNLPPGEYTIEAWHEEFGTLVARVTLGDGQSQEVEFTFDGK